MTRFGRGLFVGLLAALVASVYPAEAAATNPFAKLDAIKIDIEIGGPMDLEGGTTPELFTREVGRLTRFRTALSRGLATKLESCGILWDDGAPHGVVSIWIFGRLEQAPGGALVYVYMVKGEVINGKLEADPSGGVQQFPLRSVLGVASDEGVEAAIIDAAVAIITDDLGSCEKP